MRGDASSSEISRRTILGAGLATAAGLGLACERRRIAAIATEKGRAKDQGLPDLEVALRAASSTALVDPASGHPAEVWRFEGRPLKGPADALVQLPGGYLGPTFRVRPGQRVRIRFENGLREDSIVHWHGLDVSQENDGHPRFAVGAG